MHIPNIKLPQWVLITLLLIGFVMSSHKLMASTEGGITFFSGSWQETLDKAKAEDKAIFMDCYTSWCGPCKKLAKEVFPNEELGAYFNEHFISIKVDMEKGEGITLKDQLKVSAFPTMLFLNTNGEEMHRVVGYRTPEKLIEEAKKMQSNKGFGYYQKRYNEGDRNEQFIEEYLQVLKSANKKDELNDVAAEVLLEIKPQLWLQDKNWQLINDYIIDADSEIIRYVYDNRNHFVAIHGELAVDRKINTVYSRGAGLFASKEGDKMVLDEEGYQNYIAQLKEMGLPQWEKIKKDTDLRYTLMLEQWDAHIKLVNAKIESMGDKLHPSIIWNYAMRIDQRCNDAATRAEAARWCQLAIDRTSSEQAKKSYKRTLEQLMQPKQNK